MPGTKQLIICSLLAILFGSSAVKGEDFRPEDISNQATWYVHVDIDAIRETYLLEDSNVAIDEIEDIGLPGVPYAWLKQRYGLDKGDLHGFTIYRRKAGGERSILLLYADFSEDKVVERAEEQSTLRTAMYGDDKLYTWSIDDQNEPHGQQSTVTMAIRDGVAVFTASRDDAELELDVLNGKTQTLDPNNSLFANQSNTNELVRGAMIETEKFEGRPLLNKLVDEVQRSGFTVEMVDDEMIVNLSLQVSSEQQATSAQKLFIGIHAAAQIAAIDDEQADQEAVDATSQDDAKTPRNRRQFLVRRLPKAFDIETQRYEDEVIVSLTADLKEIREIIDESHKYAPTGRIQRQAAKPVQK